MNQFKLLGLTSLFISLLSSGQTINRNPQMNQKEWNILDESGYSIQYPTNWELNKSGQMGTSFYLFSRQTSEKDQFRENISLIIQDLTGMNIDLGKYVEISEGQIKTMITSGVIVESKRQKSGDYDFQKILFTGKQGIFDLKFEQYYFVDKQKAYVLTLTCEINEFDQYKETGEKILNSFKLKRETKGL